jgi:hypothetical protein
MGESIGGLFLLVNGFMKPALKPLPSDRTFVVCFVETPERFVQE